MPHRHFAAAALLISASICAPASAHDSPEHQIHELSQQILAEPGDAALLLQRAELYRVQQNWTAGVADLQTASRLDPEMSAVDYALADLLMRGDNPGPALAAIDRFLARQDEHIAGHLLRARILSRLGLRLEAAAEFSAGIELAGRSGTPTVQPDEYLDRARALAAEGGEHVDLAIRGLDEGIAALGAPITLQLLAFELELGRRHYDDALDRLSAIEARANRKESWIARRAQVLALAGRDGEALRSCRAALAAIEKLPPRVRSLSSTSELSSKIHAQVSELQQRQQTEGLHQNQQTEDLQQNSDTQSSAVPAAGGELAMASPAARSER